VIRPTTLGAMAMVSLLAWAPAGRAEETPPTEAHPAETSTDAAPAAPGYARDTLTGNWFGAGDRLAEAGLTIRLAATQVYQGLTRGGLPEHEHSGRYTGSYDLEIEGDLERLARLRGGSFYLLAEGGWGNSLDDAAVGSLFGANSDAYGFRSMDLTEFWYEQQFLDGRVRVRLGKLDLTGGFECRGCAVAFDGNAYANDETAQFLNGALVNNPTIPFPDNGLGVVLYVQPTERWYVCAGVADAQASATETGFRTAFHGEDYSVSLYETGYVADLPSAHGPMPGAYRLGMWYHPQPKDRFDGRRPERDDVGLYVSCDQMLLKETKDPADAQGLGAFLRFGLADQRLNAVRLFWSAGCQYRGPVPGRDDDVAAIGMARGRVTSESEAGFTRSHETVLEAYYAVQVLPWLAVSPHVQCIWHPGAMRGPLEDVILGVRVQAAF